MMRGMGMGNGERRSLSLSWEFYEAEWMESGLTTELLLAIIRWRRLKDGTRSAAKQRYEYSTLRPH